MNSSDWIALTGVAFGFLATVIASVWHLSIKISGLAQNVSSIEKTLSSVVTTIGNMQLEIGDIRIKITEMQVKMDVLWKAYFSKSESPIKLNERGLEVLEKSDIGSFANDRYDEILRKVRSYNPENAYQAQELLVTIFGQYKKNDQWKSQLQKVSFSSGYDIDSLLFVGALSIRDRVIKDLGLESGL